MTIPFSDPQQQDVLAVIPARYASTRFPGKPLAQIHGKPMIQHVWNRVRESRAIHRAIVATDDIRIFEAVQAFGGEARMTDPEHPSGTDRVWEVAQGLPEADIILNVQGDEPFIDPRVLDRVVETVRQTPEADIVTLVTPIHLKPGDLSLPTQSEAVKQWRDPNIVKAVMAENGRVLYFSRMPLPTVRDPLAEDLPYPLPTYRHIGLYAFRRRALAQFTQLPPSPLERLERLEQLRAMEAGMTLHAAVIPEAPIGVDTPEDLERLLVSGLRP
jgi:3-deoxy-manno-octulosonate cytidylyltransferase (CMP-KDO synthetase)